MHESPKPPFRWTPVFLVLAISSGGLMYRLLVFHRLEQTALLFVGIPVLLAAVIASTPKTKTIMGSVLKATTLALLLSAPLLGEGFICILMAAPIFYAVAMTIAGLAILVKKSADKPKQRVLPCLVLLAFGPMSLGRHAAITFLPSR